MKKLLSVVLFSLCFSALFSSISYAKTIQGVLGDANTVIPPTIEGAGYLLPDSPLYFLDEFKQQVRLFFAFTPLGKTMVYSSIAGERLAEARLELQKGNTALFISSLADSGKNTLLAADMLGFSKVGTQDEAKDLNETIFQHQELLDIYALHTTGDVKKAILLTDTDLFEAKAKVENLLPSVLIPLSIEEDMNREQVIVSQAVGEKTILTSEIAFLTHQASLAASLHEDNRQHALEILSAEKQSQLVQYSATSQKKRYPVASATAASATAIISKATQAASHN
ncbi:MAG TPA: DUF5667 domain-containing protein [Patescibacteria group bacterium]|nr:DUF5667 domain-containing protein [Patescibacteria group bacterium]